jgi:homoserine kinase type II
MSEEILKVLKERYHELASSIDSVDPVDAGYLSNNYILQKGTTRYFLKFYRFSDKRRIVDAHNAKSFFSSKGIPVILPLRGIDGETIQQIGDKYVSLFPFVIGSHFIIGDAPVGAVRSLGHMLGLIHKAGETGYPSISERFKSWDKNEFHKIVDQILNMIDKKDHLTDFDINARKALIFKKKSVESETLRYDDMKGLHIGLIHGDYHNGNVFFNESGEVTNVFDFEKTCIAPFAFEIVRAIRYSSVTGYGRIGSEKLVSDFIDGYRQERDISEEELKSGIELFYQHEIHGLWVEKEHYLKGNDRADVLLHSEESFNDLDHMRKI